MLPEEVRSTKQKIVNWLKEEGFAVDEQKDATAYFNILACKNGGYCSIIQNPPNYDNFLIVGRVLLSPEHQGLFKALTNDKKEDLYWDLNKPFLENNEIGDFGFHSSSPDDFPTMHICSRPIYYDELTKARFMTSVYIILKAVALVIRTLQRHLGAHIPEETKKIDECS